MASRKSGAVTPKEDSRLSRIRENQRRSRARRREYLEDLESRWKRCQELGVQANVELQKAAKRVIEENTLLRKILAESGLEAVQVDKRLQELKNSTAADDNSYGISGDNGCFGGNASDSKDVVAFLEGLRFSQPLSESALPEGSIETNLADPPRTDTDNTHAHVIDNPTAPVLNEPTSDISLPETSLDYNSNFDMSLLEISPDYDSAFDITQFLDLADPSSSQPNPIASTDQQKASSPCHDIGATEAPPPPPAVASPQVYSLAPCKTRNTTPCTEAYALLKALNAQRQEHQDMLQIVLELWNGFCSPESGEDDERKGCRVDNEILQKVIDGLK